MSTELAAAEQRLRSCVETFNEDNPPRHSDLVLVLAELQRLRDAFEELREEDHELHGAYLRLRAELERLHTWHGLMSLLDEHYPPDVPLGPDRDPGPRILHLTRELDRLRGEAR